MKKLLLATVLLLSFTANAAFVGDGATPMNVTPVKSAVELPDDSKVIIEGYIVKKLRDELYLFKDSSGEVEIEIDDEDFRNIKVTSDDKIRIKAEVDKDFTSTSLEADYLEIIK